MAIYFPDTNLPPQSQDWTDKVEGEIKKLDKRSAIVGPQGQRGAQGEPGVSGPQGERGERGEQGVQGAQGPAGERGPQGEAGQDGADGQQGPQGEAGRDGVDGAAGVQGPVGPVGPKGEKGSDGADGDSAYEVAKSEGFKGTKKEWLASLVGSSGPAGQDGAPGQDGADGTAGPAGPVGPVGPQGQIGFTGPAGPGVPTGGAAGEVLAKIDGTDYNTYWTNTLPIAGYTSVIKHEVKLGEAIAKGQAVYVSSASGTNMIVSKASNATEATSSKTLGLLESGGSTNAKVMLVAEGLLAGLNTSTATIGDPVWLGTAGDLIYGLTNKPYAPAHLVFIGVVTRVNSNNGEIFVKPQNGFELREIHDVDLKTSTPVDKNLLAYESSTSLWKNKSFSQLGLAVLAGGNAFTGAQTIAPTAVGLVPLTINSVTSQTANAVEVFDDALALRFSISRYGTTVVGGSNYGARLNVKAGTAATVAQVIRGEASQTANLQEWQESTGSINTAINQFGQMRVRTFGASVNDVAFAAFGAYATEKAIVARGVSGQTANIMEVQDSTGSPLFSVSPYSETWNKGNLYVGSAGNYGRLSVLTGAAVVGAVIRGAAAQTANLQEWQNSAASTLAKVDASGNITGTSFVRTGGTSSQFLKANGSIDSATYLDTAANQFVGHHPEGRIAYNAYLTNDFANARLRGSTITIAFNGVPYSASNANIDSMFDGTASFWNISPTASFTFPLVIELTLPRTLNYGTWVGIGFGNATWRANSVQIEVFSVDSGSWVTVVNTTTNTSEDVFAGVSGLTNGNAAGINKVRYTLSNPNSTQLRIAHIWGYNFASDMWSTTMMPRAGGAFYGGVTNTTIDPAATPLFVKAAASQTADITRWQDSAGTTLASIVANGVMRAYRGLVVNNSASANYTALQVTSTITNGIGAVIQGASGQTANLIEWQDNTSAILARIDNLGNFFTTGGIRSNYYVSYADGLTAITMLGSRNIQIGSATPSVGGGSGVVGITNAGTVPTSNPTGGGILYVDTGALKYRGTSGNAATIVNADGTTAGGGVSLSTPNTWTATQTFSAATTTAIGLLAKGIPLQTGGVFEVQNSASSTLFKITNGGTITASGNLTAANLTAQVEVSAQSLTATGTVYANKLSITQGAGWVEGYLSAQVSMTAADTFYIGPTASLPAGRWLIIGNIVVASPANTAMRVTARFGATGVGFAAGAETTMPAMGSGIQGLVTIPINCVFDTTYSGTQTLGIQVASTTAGCSIRNRPVDNGASVDGATTYFTAIRI